MPITGFARVEGTRDFVEFTVDAKDAWVLRYSWWCNRGGYIYRQTSTRVDGKVKSRNVYLHREIMGMERGDGWQCDHVNHDLSDCTRANLTVLSAGENNQKKRNRIEMSTRPEKGLYPGHVSGTIGSNPEEWGG